MSDLLPRVIKRRGSDVEVVVLDGWLPDDALEVLTATPAAGRRTRLEDVMGALVEIGFTVERSVAVSDRGDGRAGRVALIARRGADILALERSDRTKSRRKLALVEGATARALVRAA